MSIKRFQFQRRNQRQFSCNISMYDNALRDRKAVYTRIKKGWGMDFETLKKRSGSKELQRLRKHLRLDIGKHKKTKLREVLGSVGEKTLLDDGVSAKHAQRLLDQFNRRWGDLSKKEEQERLRFWTVLDSAVACETGAILRSVEKMESRLEKALESVRGVEVIGAVEIEIFNLKVLRSQADQSDQSEARKLDVLESMTPSNSLFDSFALVHFHGIVDFGKNASRKIYALEAASKKIWNKKFQTEIDGMYKDNTIGKNFKQIANYVCKGGNESLAYQIGFGRQSAERLERQMLKQGKTKLGPDFEGFENELSLTFDEIQVLGNALDQVMARRGSRNMRNGYLFRYGQRSKGK